MKSYLVFAAYAITFANASLLRQSIATRSLDDNQDIPVVEEYNDNDASSVLANDGDFESASDDLLSVIAQHSSSIVEDDASLAELQKKETEKLKSAIFSVKAVKYNMDGKIATKALSQIAPGISTLAKNIKDGNAAGAWGSAVGTAGAVLLAVPGAEAAGLALSLLGTIIGLFGTPSPSSSSPPVLTLTEIQNVVHDELQLQNQKITIAKLLADSSATMDKLKDEMVTIDVWRHQNYTTTRQKATVNYAVEAFVNRMSAYQGELTTYWDDFKSAVANGLLNDPNLSLCSNTCRFLTVPLQNWYKDQWNPDVSYLNVREWDPFPLYDAKIMFEERGQDMNQAKFKSCLNHGIAVRGYDEVTHEPFTEFHEECYTRAKRADACDSDYRRATSDFNNIRDIISHLEASTFMYFAIMKVAKNVAGLYPKFTEFYPEDFSMAMSAQIDSSKRLMQKALTWKAENAFITSYKNREVNCSNLDDIVKASGAYNKSVTSLHSGADGYNLDFTFHNGNKLPVLTGKNVPCATREYTEIYVSKCNTEDNQYSQFKCETPGAYFPFFTPQGTIGCESGDNEVDWDFKLSYDYSKIFVELDEK